MNKRRMSGFALGAAGVSLLALATLGRPPGLSAGPPAGAGAALAKAADAFVATLDPEQKKKALYPFDSPGREVWYFIPKDRDGVLYKSLNEAQRKLAHGILKAALSASGHAKAKLIISLEGVLAELEKDPVRRDPEKYYLSFFGTPAPKGAWGFRWEGHHVSLHFTVVDGTVIATSPTFFGANPAEVRQGPMKGTRALGVEEDLGRRLVKSFGEEARKQVIYDSGAPDEILTKNDVRVKALEDQGVTVAQMTKAQRALVNKLLDVYTSVMTPELARARRARFEKAGMDAIRFAWAGGLERGDRHYYRLQGPTFLVEYDNTQNGANHTHVVWRDFEGDFGRDLLDEHLKAAHSNVPSGAPVR